MYWAVEGRRNAQHDWISANVWNIPHPSPGPTLKPLLIHQLNSVSVKGHYRPSLLHQSLFCLYSNSCRLRPHALSLPSLTTWNTPPNLRPSDQQFHFHLHPQINSLIALSKTFQGFFKSHLHQVVNSQWPASLSTPGLSSVSKSLQSYAWAEVKESR